MDSVEEFLAYSIKLEQEAALRFGEVAIVRTGPGRLHCRTIRFSRARWQPRTSRLSPSEPSEICRCFAAW